jgi:hypothetical protein
MKVIVWEDTDGNCCITHPAYGDTKRPEGDTDAELLARVIAKSVKNEVYHIIEHTDIPADRYFRDAWEWR